MHLSTTYRYDLGVGQMEGTSPQGRDLIEHLLVQAPCLRLTALQALHHPWLTGDLAATRTITLELETGWMKRCLARRRWGHVSLCQHFSI